MSADHAAKATDGQHRGEKPSLVSRKVAREKKKNGGMLERSERDAELKALLDAKPSVGNQVGLLDSVSLSFCCCCVALTFCCHCLALFFVYSATSSSSAHPHEHYDKRYC